MQYKHDFHWTFYKWREDKDYANNMKVALRIMKTIREGIDKEFLLEALDVWRKETVL